MHVKIDYIHMLAQMDIDSNITNTMYIYIVHKRRDIFWLNIMSTMFMGR